MESKLVNGVKYYPTHELVTDSCDGCAGKMDVPLCMTLAGSCISNGIVWIALAKDETAGAISPEPCVLGTPGTARETQVGGSHYQNKIQPFDIIDAWELDFYEGNVLKYLLRYKYKNGSQDLKKAQHYLQKVLENHEAKHGESS